MQQDKIIGSILIGEGEQMLRKYQQLPNLHSAENDFMLES